MEKITDKIAALPPSSNYFSLEFFPPKTCMGTSNLRTRLERMSRTLRPLFVTVTWGAGGSTAINSIRLAKLCQQDLALTTCLHLTCTNSSQKIIDETLEEAHALGIRNLLALRGDPPRKEYVSPDSSVKEAVQFQWAVDLVRYIKEKYGDYFCIGVAAYPEGHADINNLQGQSLEHDLPYLVEKVKAGADFIMTQFFFDTDAYDNFEKRLQEHESGCFKRIPVIPGLMPIQSYQMIKRTLKLTHVRIPPSIEERLDPTKGDDGLAKKIGLNIICEIISHIQHSTIYPVKRRGFHFYTLNLEKVVTLILERTSLISPSFPISPNNECKSEHIVVDQSAESSQISSSDTDTERQSCPPSLTHLDLIESASKTYFAKSDSFFETTSSRIQTRTNSQKDHLTILAVPERDDSLRHEATWDDLPNGLWNDAQSPSYGEKDRYGTSLHVSVNRAIQLWGCPQSVENITSIFTNYVRGTLNTIPWSDEKLDRESDVIRDQLLELNEKGFWTIASQPAVNGTDSEDSIFGWGPRKGFVYQKAYVEFFLRSKEWSLFKHRLKTSTMARRISWYASDARGQFFSSRSSIELDQRNTNFSGNINAVTWGVFPGTEIITPTIIDEVSFRAWTKDAFGIWAEWANVYAEGSLTNLLDKDRIAAQHSQKLIEELREDVWLVNIIDHEIVEKDGLWKFLLE